MNQQVEQLVQAALGLSEEDQLRLFDALAAAIDARGLRPVNEDWLAEIARRSGEFDAGDACSVPWAVVKEHARQAISPSPGDRSFVRFESGIVEGWSTGRLTFEPKEWLRSFRDELGNAVRQLDVADGDILHGLYASDVQELCDLENILLYNVGAGRFSAAASYGLRLERSFSEGPNCPEVLVDRPHHYHRYSAVKSDAGFRLWVMGDKLAEWSFRCRDGGMLKKCSSVWYSMRRGHLRSLGLADGTSILALRLRLSVPRGNRIRTAELIKPLTDGVVAALHVHDGTDAEELSLRLSKLLGIPATDVMEALNDDKGTVLGRRKLLHRWSDKVQWNPQDDSLVALELLVDPIPADRPWQVDGELLVAEMKRPLC